MGGRGARSASSAAGNMSALSDSKLASELSDLRTRDRQLADRMSQLQMDMREEIRVFGTDENSRAKWNEARKQRQAATSRMSEIEDEQARRRKTAEPARPPVPEETRKRNVERAKLANWRNIIIEEQASRARKAAKRNGTGQYRGKR